MKCISHGSSPVTVVYGFEKCCLLLIEARIKINVNKFLLVYKQAVYYTIVVQVLPKLFCDSKMVAF